MKDIHKGPDTHSQSYKLNSVTPVLKNKDSKLSLWADNWNQLNQRTNGPPYLKRRLPPKALKVPTISVKKRNQTSKPMKKANSSSCVTLPLPGLKDCMQSRPPINPELSGPSIFSYDPPKDRPEMTNFPAFTFRPKTQSDRAGGERTAWEKEWFSHNYVWLQKADFDPRVKWPSPAHYNMKSTVGGSQPIFPQTPAHCFGRREEILFTRKGIEDEPAPNAYRQERGKDRTMRSPFSFTIPQGRKGGTTLWRKRESVPGPGSYETTKEYKSIKPRSAAFSFSVTPRKLDLETRCTF